ncbi:Required for respiratory growth protein 9 mitochondrial [Conoideocrella luteorostrata]|uniref:Required for respiratory growth protein 9, mitochondrial n=1 Tax=Conoideocrella luteorostrata TaxID=1105319 RepID=A0AAJ0CNQ9_9HYPO|nr:Required for respiratory growth protein 9 mitochondrial [Conoideocrella luteorostrata]
MRGAGHRLTVASPASNAGTLTLTSLRGFGTSRAQRQEAASPVTAQHDAADQNPLEKVENARAAVVIDAAARDKHTRREKPRKKDTPGDTSREPGASSKTSTFTATATATATATPTPTSSSPPTAPRHSSKRESTDRAQPLIALDSQNKTATKENWQTQKAALKEKFPEGWAPRKRLSPDALAGIRALNAQFPDVYTTQALADKFQVSSESIRRILKSKWTPSAEEEQDRQERWFRRGKQVWERMAAVGVKPPKKWRREGIVRDAEWHERRGRAVRREREREEDEKTEERERRARRARSRG